MPSAGENEVGPELEVTEMSEDKMSVSIKAPEDSELSPRKKKFSESSDDIEVIHEKEPPKLHGILKQRTRSMSESSDDYVFSSAGSYSRENSITLAGSETTISEEETEDGELSSSGGHKKSVSFSEHVDKTMYKANQSVSTIKATLKNKKKRAKKREQHKEKVQERRRRRTNSASSEQSSDDIGHEMEGGAEELDNEAVEESNNNETNLPDSSVENVGRLTEDHHADDEEHHPVETKQQKKKNKGRRNKKRTSESIDVNANSEKNGAGDIIEGDVIGSAAHEPPETSMKNEKNKKNGVSEKVGSAAVIMEQAGPTGACSTANPISLVQNGNTIENGNASEHEKVNKPQQKSVVNLVPNDGQDSDDENNKEEGFSEKRIAVSGKEDGERTINMEKDSDAPETMLSWQDKPRERGGEHSTQCAFSFANSVMYDLDED